MEFSKKKFAVEKAFDLLYTIERYQEKSTLLCTLKKKKVSNSSTCAEREFEDAN